MKMDLYKKILNNRYFHAIEDILLFLIITLAIHFAWRFWAYRLVYAPFEEEMQAALQLTIHQLNLQTCWVLTHIFSVPFTFQNNVIWFSNAWGLDINGSCSGFKQIAQFALLMVLFPGPWKHKSWFIPSGMAIIYLVNLVRLILLALTINNIPHHVGFIHHYLLRLMFYVVIFVLWLAWVKFFYKKELKSKTDPRNH
jgi:exosortase/archaeosortase family protein